MVALINHKRILIMKTDRRQNISEHSDEIMVQNSQPDDITAQQVPGDEN